MAALSVAVSYATMSGLSPSKCRMPMGQASTTRTTTYEQPLNERTRVLLRLEFLLQQADFALAGDSQWHTRLGVSTIADVLDLLSRGDLRTEISKELDRLTEVLSPLHENPGVDQEQLAGLLEDLQAASQALKGLRAPIGSRLKSDELLSTVIQRCGVPGGTCGFDLPGYHHWLHRPEVERREQLQAWLSEFDDLGTATDLILSLYRQSAAARPLQAEQGGYQTNLERGQPYQLIRVSLPAEAHCYPEISGSKHFVNIRFVEAAPAGDGRPAPTRTAVDFRLQCCVI